MDVNSDKDIIDAIKRSKLKGSTTVTLTFEFPKPISGANQPSVPVVSAMNNPTEALASPSVRLILIGRLP